jgi:hypothetical protein
MVIPDYTLWQGVFQGWGMGVGSRWYGTTRYALNAPESLGRGFGRSHGRWPLGARVAQTAQ